MIDPIDAAAEKNFAPEGGAPAPNVPSDPPAVPTADPPPNAPPTGSTGSPAPVGEPAKPQRRLVKYKFDKEDEELDVDDAVRQFDEWAKDPTKTHPIVDLVQKGRAHDRVSRRRYEEGVRDLVSWARKRGYDFKPNKPNPVSWEDYDLVPPAPAPAASPAQPATDPDAIREKELRKKIREEADPATMDELFDMLDKRSAKRASEAEERALFKWRQEQEAAQRSTREQAEYESRLSEHQKKIVSAIERRAKSFDTNALRARAFDLAWSRLWGKDGSEENALREVETFANEIDSDRNRVSETVKAGMKAPPPAPPLLGGPGGSGKPASDGRPLDLDDDAAMEKVWTRLQSPA